MYDNSIDLDYIRSLKLNPGLSWALHTLATKSKNGKSSMPASVLAEIVNVSERSIKKYLKELKERGLIKVIGYHKQFKNNIYLLTHKLYKPKNKEKSAQQEKNKKPSVQNVHVRGAESAHTIYNHISSYSHTTRAHEDEVPPQEENPPPKPKHNPDEFWAVEETPEREIPQPEKITNIEEAREMKRKFPMTDDFQLNDKFLDQCRMAGLNPDSLDKQFLSEALAEFKDYWVDEYGRQHTRRQWQAKLIMNIKRNPPKKQREQTHRAEYKPKYGYTDLSVSRKSEIDEEMRQIKIEMMKERAARDNGTIGLRLAG